MDKRVITIIIFFAVLAVLLIIGATVFVVRDVQVSFATQAEASVISVDEIKTASQITTGKNIFAISESKAVSNIEKEYPAIKVINIERRFPSTIIIHVTARIPILAAKIAGQDKYALLDREMFVVEILSQNELNNRETQFGHLLAKADYTLDSKDVQLGQIIPENASNENAIAQNIIVAFEEKGLLNHGFSDFISDLKIDPQIGMSGYDITITTRSGLDILFDSTGKLDEKVGLAYDWYCAEIDRLGSDAESVTTGYILFVLGEGEADNYFTWYRYSN